MATFKLLFPVLLALSAFALLAVTSQAGGYDKKSYSWLAVGYYSESCPKAEEIVMKTVKWYYKHNLGLLAGVIRMLFHDCFIRGCDASVLLDPTPANPQPEKLGIPNNPSLRGFEVIDAAKKALEKACPGVVSCADILAFAASDAANFLSHGAVDIRMPAGRYDGRVSLANETLVFLPGPSFNLSNLITSFALKNLTEQDMIILSGAHTVGRSHCSSFSDRLTTPLDPKAIDVGFAMQLQRECVPMGNVSDPVVVLDVVTPTVLDSQYYRNVLDKKVLFNSDASLLASGEAFGQVVANAFTPGLWERAFEDAVVKMALIEVKDNRQGEIRKNCRVVNKGKH